MTSSWPPVRRFGLPRQVRYLFCLCHSLVTWRLWGCRFSCRPGSGSCIAFWINVHMTFFSVHLDVYFKLCLCKLGLIGFSVSYTILCTCHSFKVGLLSCQIKERQCFEFFLFLQITQTFCHWKFCGRIDVVYSTHFCLKCREKAEMFNNHCFFLIGRMGWDLPTVCQFWLCIFSFTFSLRNMNIIYHFYKLNCAQYQCLIMFSIRGLLRNNQIWISYKFQIFLCGFL